MIIPVPLFEPDRSPFLFQAGDNLINCLPVRDGWGPMQEFVKQSEALPSECKGAAFVMSNEGAVEIIAGTTTNLYLLNTSSVPYTWTSIGSGYNVGAEDEWQFAKYGDYLVATQLGDAPQKYLIGSGLSFSDVGGNPPRARHVGVAGDFLVLGGLENRPNAIHWSGLNDLDHWTVLDKSSDEQDFPDGGGLKRIIGDQQGALLMFRDKFRVMNFAPGSGWIFTTQEINSARGSVAENSIVQIRNRDFVYLSEDGFFRGVEGTPIGNDRVDQWMQANIDLVTIQDVQGAKDPYNKIVWWRFQRTDGTSALIGYDWQLDRWCYSDADVRYLANVASPGVTIDGLDAYFATIDDVDVAFDSRFMTGGRPTFGAFMSDNTLAFASGGSMQATFRTAQLELTPNKRTFVNGFRAETDAINLTGRVGASDRFGDSSTFTPSLSLETRSHKFNTRSAARLHQFEVVIPAGETWSTITNIRPDASLEGEL